MPTRALCISDLTSEEACLDYLQRFILEHAPELILLPGDVTQNGPLDYAEDVLSICAVHKLPVVAVHGNNDPPRVQELLSERTHYVHARKARVLGFEFAGVGGSNPTPFGTVCEYTEEQLEGFLAGKVGPKTIVVSHVGPQGVLDEPRKDVHLGSTALHEMVERSRPRAVVCGHVHEAEGEARVGQTKIVKVAPLMHGRAVLLDLDTLRTKFIRV